MDLEDLKDLFATMSGYESRNLEFAIYDANTGAEFRLVDAYFDGDAFCLDIERTEAP